MRLAWNKERKGRNFKTEELFLQISERNSTVEREAGMEPEGFFFKRSNNNICLYTDWSDPVEVEKNNDTGERGDEFGSKL